MESSFKRITSTQCTESVDYDILEGGKKQQFDPVNVSQRQETGVDRSLYFE